MKVQKQETVVKVPDSIKKNIKDIVTLLIKLQNDYKKEKQSMSLIIETFLVAKDLKQDEWELNEEYDFVPITPVLKNTDNENVKVSDNESE